MRKTFTVIGFLLIALAILVFYFIYSSCIPSVCGPADSFGRGSCSADCGGHKDYTTGYWVAGLGLLSLASSRIKFKK